MGARDGYLAALYYWAGEDRTRTLEVIQPDSAALGDLTVRVSFKDGVDRRYLGARGPLAPGAVARALLQERAR